MKNNFKNFIIAIFAVLIFLSPVAVLAGEAVDEAPKPFDQDLIKAIANKSFNTEDVDQTTLAKVIGGIVRGLLSFLGVIFISLMVYGGYRWLTARGNDQIVSSAKEIIRNAVIGTIITASAYGMWQLIETYVF